MSIPLCFVAYTRITDLRVSHTHPLTVDNSTSLIFQDSHLTAERIKVFFLPRIKDGASSFSQKGCFCNVYSRTHPQLTVNFHSLCIKVDEMHLHGIRPACHCMFGAAIVGSTPVEVELSKLKRGLVGAVVVVAVVRMVPQRLLQSSTLDARFLTRL